MTSDFALTHDVGIEHRAELDNVVISAEQP